MTIIKCDHCGETISVKDLKRIDIDLGEDWITYDLCPECMEEMSKGLEGMIYGEKSENERC